MGSEDAKSFPPTIFSPPPILFLPILWGVALIFFSSSPSSPFYLPHPWLSFLYFFPFHKGGWLSFFKNLSLPFGLTGPSISEPQAVVKNGIKIGLAQKKIAGWGQKKGGIILIIRSKRGGEIWCKRGRVVGGRKDSWSWDKKTSNQEAVEKPNM